MPKYRVFFVNTASTHIDVEIDHSPDEEPDMGDAMERVEEKLTTGEADLPSPCASCAGMGRGDTGFELSGDWEASEMAKVEED